ncbi:MAG: Ig-like domain-containing protein, partial [Pelagimonas sp.]|nr:Ig-like domain-containing protein [Pelagimonas sp.]
MYGEFDGTSWTTQVVEQASHPSGWRNFDNPSLAIDSSGVVHIGYDFRLSENPRKYDIKYANDSSGSFAPEIRYRFDAASGLSSGINEVDFSTILTGPAGTMHLFYLKEDNINSSRGNLYYQSRDASGNWSSEQLIDGTYQVVNPNNFVKTGTASNGMAAYNDPNGHALVFFVEGGDLKAYSTASGTPTKVTILTGVAAFHDYAVNGTTEILHVTTSAGSPHIYSRFSGSSSWNQEFVVTSHTGTEIAINSTNRVMVVQSESLGSNGGSGNDLLFVTDTITVPDNTPPVLSSVTIPNSSMKVGDVVTVTITVTDDGGDVYSLTSGTVGGFTLGNLSRVNSTTYTAQFTVPEGGTDVAAGSN